MDGAATLTGFAYGEDLEDGSGRSLGYRLLTPSAPWSAEVEALARRLQAAPYPDTWPAADLFCSVILADGSRLVALARYGLSDHTASRRRGGFELLGLVAPGGTGVNAALAIYRWLGRRHEEPLHSLGATFTLADVLAAAPPEAPARPDGTAGPVPVLPVRLWNDGVLLFAAAAPADPDHHLRLLEHAASAHWQWLPLVGPDFPLPAYAQRGPLVAWTAHLAGVAVRLDRPAHVPVRGAQPAGRWMAAGLAALMLALLAGNLWYMRRVKDALANAPGPPTVKAEAKKLPATHEPDEGRDRFARELYRLLRERIADERRDALLDRYAAVVRGHPDLAVSANNEEGKLAIGALASLAARTDGSIDRAIRQALEGKGFSDKLIQAARDHVREKLADVDKEP